MAWEWGAGPATRRVPRVGCRLHACAGGDSRGVRAVASRSVQSRRPRARTGPSVVREEDDVLADSHLRASGNLVSLFVGVRLVSHDHIARTGVYVLTGETVAALLIVAPPGHWVRKLHLKKGGNLVRRSL